MAIWQKLFNKITFKDYPDVSTPLNATNLNAMTDAIDRLDDRIVELGTDLGYIKEYSFTLSGNSSITFTAPNHSIFLITASANNKNLRYVGFASFGTYNGAEITDIKSGANITATVVDIYNVKLTNNASGNTNIKAVRVGGVQDLQEL